MIIMLYDRIWINRKFNFTLIEYSQWKLCRMSNKKARINNRPKTNAPSMIGPCLMMILRGWSMGMKCLKYLIGS